VTKRHKVKSVEGRVRLAGMVLRRPFRRIFIPEEKYLVAYRISVLSENLLFFFCPVSPHVGTCYQALMPSFSMENDLALLDIRYCLNTESYGPVKAPGVFFLLLPVTGHSLMDNVPQKT